MGQTLNTMTLGGFAVALGVLVDDAIIGIENILRRLARMPSWPIRDPRLRSDRATRRSKCAGRWSTPRWW